MDLLLFLLALGFLSLFFPTFFFARIDYVCMYRAFFLPTIPPLSLSFFLPSFLLAFLGRFVGRGRFVLLLFLSYVGTCFIMCTSITPTSNYIFPLILQLPPHITTHSFPLPFGRLTRRRSILVSRLLHAFVRPHSFYPFLSLLFHFYFFLFLLLIR